jgi:hypothetical protein
MNLWLLKGDDRWALMHELRGAPDIVPIASDKPLAHANVPVLDLVDLPTIARFVLHHAEPFRTAKVLSPALTTP